MTQFHEGQKVEVKETWNMTRPRWSNAKIVSGEPWHDGSYAVQFPDGTRAVFDAEHIRAVSKRGPPLLEKLLNESLFGKRKRARAVPP